MLTFLKKSLLVVEPPPVPPVPAPAVGKVMFVHTSTPAGAVTPGVGMKQGFGAVVPVLPGVVPPVGGGIVVPVGGGGTVPVGGGCVVPVGGGGVVPVGGG